jgi:hypothetical protein
VYGFFEAKREFTESGYRKVKGGGVLPYGDWKRVTGLLSSKGIQYRRDEVVRFSNLLFEAHREGREFSIELHREPSNNADENALKVIGSCAEGEFHVGYVDQHEAARIASRFPNVPLAAEFYSNYHTSSDYVDLRFFVCVPEGTTPENSSSVRQLLEIIEDELVVLTVLAAADGKRGRFEGEILNKFALARSYDLSLNMTEEDLKDIRGWIKDQEPSIEELVMAVDRVADAKTLSAAELLELATIMVEADGKITKAEYAAINALREQIALSFGTKVIFS